MAVFILGNQIKDFFKNNSKCFKGKKLDKT